MNFAKFKSSHVCGFRKFILQNLNRVMYADLENSHRFVTLFYSEYNPITRILSYSNAAHNPPLWWHAATKTVTRLDTLGMLIGLDANSQYEDAQAQLEPGLIVNMKMPRHN